MGNEGSFTIHLKDRDGSQARSTLVGASATCSTLADAHPDLLAWRAFYGARGQETGPLHAVGLFFCRRRPRSLDCRFDGSGWVRSSAPYRSPKVLHSRGVLRSRAGTILLSGTLWPIASFGSPEGHSLSRGTRATRPSPAFQWMLSPVTGLLPVRRTRLHQRSLPPHARRSRILLLRRFQSRRVVPLARAP